MEGLGRTVVLWEFFHAENIVDWHLQHYKRLPGKFARNMVLFRGEYVANGGFFGEFGKRTEVGRI